MPRVCSITDALALVGERYSLLVVRELRYGRTRFTQLLNGTGAPRDVLTRRLRELEEAGIVERRLYSERPPRAEYHLTDKGRELGVVVGALAQWGTRHLHHEHRLVNEACGHPVKLVYYCPTCDARVRGTGIRMRKRKGARRATTAR